MKAVCYQCGKFKETAWEKCNSCHHRPLSEDDRAKSLLLSTHFNNEKKLQQFADHLQNGKIIDYKPKELLMVTEVLHKKMISTKEQRKYMLKLIACFVLTIISMVLFYLYKKSGQ